MPTVRNQILQIMLLSFVVVAIFVYGGVHPETQVWLQGVLILVGLVVVVKPPTLGLASRAALVGYLLLCGLMTLSIFPVPGVGSLWPEMTAGALNVWILVGGFGLWLTISVTKPFDNQFVSSAVSGLIFILGAFVVLHGLIGSESVLDVFVHRQSEMAFIPPFVNSNHTATLVLWALPILWFSPKASQWGFLTRGGALVIVAAMLIYCTSVGAYLSLLALGFLWLTRSRSWVFRYGGVIAASLMGVSILFLLLENTTSLWEAQSFQLRLHIWRDVIDFAGNQPILGTGLGTFETAHRAWGTIGWGTVSHAHSEPLHGWAESGLLGFAAIILFTGWFVRLEGSLSGVQKGVWYGVAGVLIHSLVDFQLHMPGVAVVVIGSLVWLRATSYPDKPWLSGFKVRWIAAGLVALQLGALLSTLAFVQVEKSMSDVGPASSKEELLRSLSTLERWDVWGHRSLLVRAWLQSQEGDERAAKATALNLVEQYGNHTDVLRGAATVLIKLGEGDEALSAIEQAIHWGPNDYRNWVVKSVIHSRLDEPDAALSAWKRAIGVWPARAPTSPIDRALRLNPIGLLWLDVLKDAHPQWTQELGDQMLKQGDNHTAVLAYELAKEQRPTYWGIPFFGLAMVRAGQVEEGLAELDDLMRRYPDSNWIIRQKAYAYEHLEDFEPAAQFWMEAARVGEGDPGYSRCIQMVNKAYQTAQPDDRARLSQLKARCQVLCTTCK